mmetsp:Transcript_1603/g.3141  ORF Transcript_1603/g.3141 Transcript_1603/m.3141 type:complete len:136 (+) Transcript_1603:70-477(+)|eukprot:CAMPEP_0197644710 /NCGR_PEP_ID=MMETSP1338-20131121/17593_1 /TAXON_ID=43686 ORGANISM="Pelagodinium beii, Strain RCC1491" /NCGR_SAMPLE_ID=MMETSP1338 /ASSEMBLY_ACC=CAM_ASM_000754 /LENGTH=135 /DNA_ID=CAMNT_0043218147 /DNA_START=77 /DNA_END=484 /DNA_ORIENTATION=+
MAGQDVLWMCVKKNSAFLRKSNNLPVMSADPANLTGLNKQKYSGLAHKKAVNVSSINKGKKETILMTAHSVNGGVRTGKRFFTITGMSKAVKPGGKTMCRLAAFRPDLAEEAAAKYAKVKKSFKKGKVVVKSRRA